MGYLHWLDLAVSFSYLGALFYWVYDLPLSQLNAASLHHR